MKKIIIALFMLSSINIMAQQKKSANPKLEALQNENDQAVLQQKLNALESGTAEDLDLLIRYYAKDEAKKVATTKILIKKYPESPHGEMARIRPFLKLKEASDAEAFAQSLMKDYPNLNLDLEKSMVACAYAEDANTPKILQYVNAIEDPGMRVQCLMQAIDIVAAVDNTIALNLTAQGLEDVRRFKERPLTGKPMKVDPKATYYSYINLYSKLLFKAGKNETAYKYTAEAYKNGSNRDAELTENYAFLSSSLKGNYEEALPILANSVKEGKFEKKYVDEVKKGYAKFNPGKDVNAYIAGLKSVFIDKIKAHVSKLMINEPAPDFYLTDVTGKKVTLADFKGKTIVLDFWATWCGPCVASFPAMQMAVNRYVNDPNVKFLFIHTWENDPNPLADATGFLKKRNYKFDLYMDPRNPATKHSAAADAFKIKGIPAKFIIDGNGSVRFSISGFKGKSEAAAEEVVQMVEMARKGA